MEGRGSGTPGGVRAGQYIADRLQAMGLRPGGEGGSFFQPFALSGGCCVGTRERPREPRRVGQAPSREPRLDAARRFADRRGEGRSGVRRLRRRRGRAWLRRLRGRRRARQGGAGACRWPHTSVRPRAVAAREAHRRAPSWRERDADRRRLASIARRHRGVGATGIRDRHQRRGGPASGPRGENRGRAPSDAHGLSEPGLVRDGRRGANSRRPPARGTARQQRHRDLARHGSGTRRGGRGAGRAL